jgi:hypothetical protein
MKRICAHFAVYLPLPPTLDCIKVIDIKLIYSTQQIFLEAISKFW